MVHTKKSKDIRMFDIISAVALNISVAKEGSSHLASKLMKNYYKQRLPILLYQFERLIRIYTKYKYIKTNKL